MELEILNAKTARPIATLKNLTPTDTIRSLKHEIHKRNKRLNHNRQEFRLEPRGKSLNDEELLKNLNFPSNDAKLYLKDLGPQIGWQNVLLIEYAGPFLLYPLLYFRPDVIYGAGASNRQISPVVHLAMFCWTLHYGKRLYETVFVHRWSHATMPLRNVFKNSIYYWGCALFISYFINHPLYTPPQFGFIQVAIGFTGFLFSECGNYSIHMALRNLRPEGSKERKIPMPTSNPFTRLFDYVSCPHYTYEFFIWISLFTITQCLPVLVFAFLGLYQMTSWAKGKHRNYRKEFPDYPKERKAILPFLV